MEKTSENIASPTSAQVEEFRQALPEIAETWQEKDPYVSALAESLFDLLESEKARNYLQAKLFSVRNISSEYAFNLIRTIAQVQFAPNREENGYPFADKSGWTNAITKLMTQDGIHLDDIEYALESRDVQTNIEERYKLLNALLAMFDERFGSQPRVVDFGCGQNRGLAAMMDPEYSFEPLEVLDDPTANNELNEWIGKQLTLLRHLGIDAWALRDSGNYRWSLYNGYPSEQNDPDYEQNYEKLIKKRDELGIDFIVKDIIAEPLVGTPEIPVPHSFDAVFCSMMLYEHDQAGVDKIVSVAENELLDQQKGLFIIFDAVEVDPEDANKLKFLKNHTKPYTIRLLVKDMAHKERGYQEVLVLETGRALRAKRGIGYHCIRSATREGDYLASELATNEA